MKQLGKTTTALGRQLAKVIAKTFFPTWRGALGALIWACIQVNMPFLWSPRLEGSMWLAVMIVGTLWFAFLFEYVYPWIWNFSTRDQ